MGSYKVPSPGEIKKKFQKPAYLEDWVSHNILRRMSRYMTWFLLHFTLCAECIALMTPIVDALTIYLISEGNWIVAAILTQLHIIVDCSDGEIARFRETVRKRTRNQKKWGAYVDSMAGMILFPVVIFSASYYMGSLITGLVGMAAFYLTVASSAYAKAYFSGKKKSKTAKLREKYTKGFKTKIGFSSYVQKTLITLALLFQSLIFIWIFSTIAVFMVGVRLWVYRK